MTSANPAPYPSSQARRKRGFNLIEAAVVLGVVGVVIGGIWVAAASFYSKHISNRLMQDSIIIVNNIRNLYTSYSLPDCNQACWQTLASGLKIFPADWAGNRTPYKILLYVETGSTVFYGPSAIRLRIAEVPKAICNDTVFRMTKGSYPVSARLVAVGINWMGWHWIDAPSSNLNALDAATISNRCLYDSNTLALEFAK